MDGNTGFNHSDGKPDGAGPDGDTGRGETGSIGGVVGKDEASEGRRAEDGVVGVLAVVVVEGRVVGRLVADAGREKVGFVVDKGVEGRADGLEGFFKANIGVDEGEP